MTSWAHTPIVVFSFHCFRSFLRFCVLQHLDPYERCNQAKISLNHRPLAGDLLRVLEQIVLACPNNTKQANLSIND